MKHTKDKADPDRPRMFSGMYNYGKTVPPTSDNRPWCTNTSFLHIYERKRVRCPDCSRMLLLRAPYPYACNSRRVHLQEVTVEFTIKPTPSTSWGPKKWMASATTKNSGTTSFAYGDTPSEAFNDVVISHLEYIDWELGHAKSI